MEYQSFTLRRDLSIPRLFSIHFFEYPVDFVFPGEMHNFWELMYVDSGSVEVTAGERVLMMEKGQIIFHQPNEFHALRATGKDSPCLIVVSFECTSPGMDVFREQMFVPDTIAIPLLSHIVAEAQKSLFISRNDSFLHRTFRTETAPFGSEQMIQCCLEMFLITLRRQLMKSEDAPPPPTQSLRDSRERLLQQVKDYMELHIYDSPKLEDICRENNISRSSLQGLFHKFHGCGVMEYFSQMKIETAKRLIREKNHSFSQIAAMLNYSSYQYFSLQFRKYTRMSPREYSTSTRSFIPSVPQEDPLMSRQRASVFLPNPYDDV